MLDVFHKPQGDSNQENCHKRATKKGHFYASEDLFEAVLGGFLGFAGDASDRSDKKVSQLVDDVSRDKSAGRRFL